MPKKSSFQQSQTWYVGYMPVFENAKFLWDLTIHCITIALHIHYSSNAFYSTLLSFSVLKIFGFNFLSYILVPFPDSSNLYSCTGKPNKEWFDIENFLAVVCRTFFTEKTSNWINLIMWMDVYQLSAQDWWWRDGRFKKTFKI